MFDNGCFYSDPLPVRQQQPNSGLIDREGDGFKTTATSAWPPLLCKSLATSVVSWVGKSLNPGKTLAIGQGVKRQSKEEEGKAKRKKTGHRDQEGGAIDSGEVPWRGGVHWEGLERESGV